MWTQVRLRLANDVIDIVENEDNSAAWSKLEQKLSKDDAAAPSSAPDGAPPRVLTLRLPKSRALWRCCVLFVLTSIFFDAVFIISFNLADLSTLDVSPLVRDRCVGIEQPRASRILYLAFLCCAFTLLFAALAGSLVLRGFRALAAFTLLWARRNLIMMAALVLRGAASLSMPWLAEDVDATSAIGRCVQVIAIPVVLATVDAVTLLRGEVMRGRICASSARLSLPRSARPRSSSTLPRRCAITTATQTR